MKRKKLLIIPWTISDGGGSERILANILSGLQYNFDIEVFEIQRGEHKNYIEEFSNIKFRYLFKKKNNNENRLYQINRKLKFSMIKYFSFIAKNIYFNEEYDYVISFNYLYPSFIASYFKCKKIMWIHGTMDNLNDATERLVKIKQGKAFEKTNKIVTIAKTTAESVERLFPEYKNKNMIIYNGMNLERIRNLANETTEIKNYDFVAIGRLDKNKNFIALLDVINNIKKSKKDITLAILGEGEQKKIITDKIKELGLEKNIYILGYKNNSYPYIKNAKVLLVSSLSEGFPTVIIEALALGKPFISTNVGGSDELSHGNKCGFVVSSYEEMTIKAFEFLDNGTLYNEMSKNCFKISEKYELEKQINQINNLLLEES